MNMHRRDFVRLAGLGMAAAGSVADRAAAADPQSSKGERPPRAPAKALMKVGTQHDSSDDVLGVLAALGVTNICSRLPSARLDDQWSVEGLTRLRERVE